MLKYKFISVFAILVMVPFVFFGKTFAQTTVAAFNVSCKNNTSIFGLPTWYEFLPMRQETIQGDMGFNTSCVPVINNIADIWLIVAAIIEILLRVAGIAAVVMIIYAAVRYTTSMGTPEVTAQALNTIIYSLVGLLIAISAAFLVTFIAKGLGA